MDDRWVRKSPRERYRYFEPRDWRNALVRRGYKRLGKHLMTGFILEDGHDGRSVYNDHVGKTILIVEFVTKFMCGAVIVRIDLLCLEGFLQRAQESEMLFGRITNEGRNTIDLFDRLSFLALCPS